MKAIASPFFFVLVFLLPAGAVLFPVAAQVGLPFPETEAGDERPLRQIHLRVPEADRDSIVDRLGMKYEVKDPEVLLDGREVPARWLRIRGRSSTRFRRKSFHLAFEDYETLAFGATTRRLEKVYLISMSMDRSYFQNKLAFACLQELGLFQLQHCYVEVFLNGQSEGLYLLMQRPEDYVLQDLQGAYIMRRGYREAIDDYDVAEELRRRTERKFNELYPEVVRACRERQGQDLYDYLNERIDMRSYMKWLAFNFWVQNGDYTDEVYFYSTAWKDTVHLQVLPWDYDDIFAPKPHEGSGKRDKALGDKLLFSSEGVVDRAIADDPLLYAKYLEALREVLHYFTEERLQAIFAGIYSDLAPYLREERILHMSQFDKYGATSLETLRTDMDRAYEEFLVKNRREVLEKL